MFETLVLCLLLLAACSQMLPEKEVVDTERSVEEIIKGMGY